MSQMIRNTSSTTTDKILNQFSKTIVERHLAGKKLSCKSLGNMNQKFYNLRPPICFSFHTTQH